MWLPDSFYEGGCMRIQIIKNPNDEVVITIACPEVNDEIKAIINQLESFNMTLIGKSEIGNTILPLNDIFYFEAFDNKVFAYVKDNVFEVDKKIVELNDLLKATSFIQISRTIILNINNVLRIQTLVNGRLLAHLTNGEKLIITRLYAKDFKDKLKGGRR